MILQVVTDTDRRGAQVFATDLHRSLEASGRSVRTVALAPGTVGGLELPVLGEHRMSVETLRALRRELKTATVAVAHGSTTLPASAVATLGTRTPFVYRQISDSRYWAPSGLRQLRVRLALARASAVVVLWSGSASVLEDHLSVRRDRITVIPNGVATDHFVPADSDARARARVGFALRPDRFTAVFVGALVSEKGADIAVEAIARCPGTQLLVVGDGPERAALQARAARLAPGRIHVAGPLEDPVAAYAAADVVLLPSRGGDSMPAVLIEAGLMGVPAVATPIDAIPEIVVSGVTGQLVAVGSVEDTARAIREIEASPAKALATGAAARAHCLEHFSIERVGAQWADLLDAVVNRRSQLRG